MGETGLYTADELIRKYKNKYIDTFPHFYVRRNSYGKWITFYEVRGVSKTLKENYNLPEDCIIPK